METDNDDTSLIWLKLRLQNNGTLFGKRKKKKREKKQQQASLDNLLKKCKRVVGGQGRGQCKQVHDFVVDKAEKDRSCLFVAAQKKTQNKKNIL